MSNRFVILIIAIVVVVIAGIYFYIPFDDPAVIVEKQKEGEVAGDESFVPERIVADHFYKDGTHTLQGLINLPTPCHSLTNDSLVAESMPEQVTINFTSQATNGICTQVISEKFFSISFSASKEAKMTAKFNGFPVELVLNEQGSSIQKL